MRKTIIASLLAASTVVGGSVAMAPEASAVPVQTIPIKMSCDTMPLPRTHWYGQNDGTPYSHSGLNSTDQWNIKKIQRVLNAAGYSIPVDGHFGPATFRATVYFQKDLNRWYYADTGHPAVSVDGKYGYFTWYHAWNYGFGEFQC